MKIGRNDPCLCGSGKKNKACCKIYQKENKVSFFDFNPEDVFIEMFKLQLDPENHGKNLRIERALGEYLLMLKSCSSKSLNFSKFDSRQFLSELNNRFKPIVEDPPENSHTENLIFNNKNYLVFAGISEEATPMVQNLLDALIICKNNLPKEFVNDVFSGVTFLLEIHDKILVSSKFTRNYFLKSTKTELCYSNEKNPIKPNLFEFQENHVKIHFSNSDINLGILNEFSVEPMEFIFDSTKPNSNSLLLKPFVKYNDHYYLVMPTAEMTSISEFIYEKARSYGCINELLIEYEKLVYTNGLRLLSEINFHITNIATKNIDFISEPPFLTVLQFDLDKFAIFVMPERKGSNQHSVLKFGLVKSAISKIKSINKKFKIHLLILSNRFSTLDNDSIEITIHKNIDFTTVFSLFQLQGLNTLFKIDNLSLWKFQKNFDLVSTSIYLTPGFNILTYFNWFTKNQGSMKHTDEDYNYMVFSFKDQADLIRKTHLLKDLHAVNFPVKSGAEFAIPVVLKEPYLPIYIPALKSDQIELKVIKIYNFPLWMQCKTDQLSIGLGIIETISFWFTELASEFKRILKVLGSEPILISIDIDPSFFGGSGNNPNNENNLTYFVNQESRFIGLHIPYKFVEKNLEVKNNIEKIIISNVLEAMMELMLSNNGVRTFSLNEVEFIISQNMDNSEKRMILPSNDQTAVSLSEVQVIQKRFLQDSDISFIRENILNWAKIENLNKVISKIDKTQLCNKLVTVLIEHFRKSVDGFDAFELLRCVIIRYESCLFYSSYRDFTIGSKLINFNNQHIVKLEYEKESILSITSLLAYRCLIEFIIAEPPKNKSKIVNQDDVDFLHALTEQIINFGNLSEVIHEEFSDTPISKLPSGRIGIKHDFFENEMYKFKNSLFEQELSKTINKTQFEIANESIDDELITINQAFSDDWGVSIYEIVEILDFLSHYALNVLEASFASVSEKEFLNLFDDLPFSRSQIECFLNIMVMKSRGNIAKPPSGFRNEDVFPWRYNRRLSYINKPILLLEYENQNYYVWSPRHLEVASNNLLGTFYNGTLKVSEHCKKIQSELAKQNNLKGKIFRLKVLTWLKSNSPLHILPHELKITSRSPLKANRDYGDIDIFAFDLKTKTILLLELKNTKQAKVVYEFKRDIENYLNRLIPKHLERSKWISENMDKLSDFLNVDVTSFKVFSAIISSTTLPLKYMAASPIPIFSFTELKEKGIDLLQIKNKMTS